jgi:hypothetical protein
MALPKLDTPSYSLVIPSTGEKVKYRPFLVKEERVLLMALEGGDEAEIQQSVLVAIGNCIIDDVDINKLTQFDIEYIFLQLRAKSVGEVVKLRFRHRDMRNRKGDKCDVTTKIDVNLADIEPPTPSVPDKVMITDTVGVKLKYPNADDIKKVSSRQDLATRYEYIMAMLVQCVEYIWDEETVYKPEDIGEKEFIDFMESLSPQQFQHIETFFDNIPTVKYKIEYTCEGCGEHVIHQLIGLTDFFG